MAKSKTEAANYERLTVRLPPVIIAALRDQAAQEERPLNTHIIRLLRHACGKPDKRVK